VSLANFDAFLDSGAEEELVLVAFGDLLDFDDFKNFGETGSLVELDGAVGFSGLALTGLGLAGLVGSKASFVGFVGFKSLEGLETGFAGLTTLADAFALTAPLADPLDGKEPTFALLWLLLTFLLFAVAIFLIPFCRLREKV
jgi:hypothetical protein